MKKLSVLFLICFPVLLLGQQTHQYVLRKVDNAGWYSLRLSPEMRKHMQPEMHDIRMFCSGDTLHPVSYSIKKAENIHPLLQLESLNWNYESPLKKSILIQLRDLPCQSVLMRIANHETERSYKLSGSINGKEWFAVADKGVINAGNGIDGYYWEQVSFPRVSYSWLKLEYTDSNAQALNIDAVVTTRQHAREESLSLVKDISCKITQIPSLKLSRITIFSKYVQEINKLNIHVKSPALYKRNASIYFKNRNEEISQIMLASGLSNSFEINLLLNDTLCIDVYNEDNTALEIDGLLFMQTPVILLTYLEAGCTPVLFCGDRKLPKPQYDLPYFTEKADADTIQELVLENTIEQLNPKKDTTEQAELPFWQSQWFTWLVLIAGGATVFYFAIKLIGSNTNRD